MSTALSPPPRTRSPQHAPSSSVPPPPLIPHRSSRSRLIPTQLEEPPIPPRLIGSPLLQKLTASHEPHVLSQKVQSELWIDGDEFGTQKSRAESSSTPSPVSPASSPSSRRGHRRSPSVVATCRSRSHSPPPTPQFDLPPPPVPPIPLSALATPGARRSVVRPRPLNGRQIVIPDMDQYSSPTLSSPPKHKRIPRSLDI
ncbi:hypothetical protein BKA93DRAFT_275606 [Sparassis latifolia]|uniref:Uncharacterized protein n=1 Tax=Sparassis crispa TaxID=139825 RepID=A0A401GBT8_9APHY|nr:hypothetical protein SCP_0208560 [Sparassis crispa]GBE79656.1 hypothetical protein SCP_0208560 [Sparassis crispa]